MEKSRVRERGGLTWAQYDWTSTNRFTCRLGTTHNGGPFNTCLVGTYERMEDIVSEGYHKRSRNGEVIVKPYGYFRESYTASGNGSSSQSINPSCTSPATVYNVETVDGPYGLAASGHGDKLGPFVLLSDEDISSAVLAAATKAWQDANGHDAEILQDLAESGQTLSMLKSPTTTAKNLLSSITRAKKGSKLKSLGKTSVETANNLWLQYRYGVRPLVSSLNGVVQAMGRLNTKHRWTARGKYPLERTRDVSGTKLLWNVGFNWNRRDSHRVNVRAGILLEENLTLSNNLGVDASGMLSLPWELVPYSFVADWFINVGDYIGALVPSLTKQPLASWWTVEQLFESKLTIGTSFNNSPSTYTLLRGMSGEWTGTQLYKQRYLALPRPSITLKPQALTKVLSDLRVLDSAALAFQRLGNALKG
jgi:hypothetical protein